MFGLEKLILPPTPQLMRHPNGTSLLRAPSGLAGSEDCCCDDETPVTTCGNSYFSGCFSDLLPTYPNNSNLAAFITAMSAIQFDVGLNGGFTGSCADNGSHSSLTHCDVAGNGPYVLPWDSGKWDSGLFNDLCPASGTYRLRVTLEMACSLVEGTPTCRAVIISNYSSSLAPTWAHVVDWRTTYPNQRVFSGVSDSAVPVSTVGDVPGGVSLDPDGSHQCAHDGTSTASYAMH